MPYLRGEPYFGIRMKQRRDFCRVMRNTTVVDNIIVSSLRMGEDFDLLLNIFTLSRFIRRSGESRPDIHNTHLHPLTKLCVGV